MNSKIKKLDNNNTYELDIELDDKDLKEYFESVYKDIQKDLEIAGFRKGKAPMDLIKKRYHNLAKEKVLDLALPEVYNQIIKERDINPITDPVVKDIDFKSDANLFFKIQIPVKPEIKLGKYKGIKLIKDKIHITDKEIEETLKRIQYQNSTVHPVNDEAKDGHYVDCDLVCEIDSEKIEEKRSISLPIKKEFPISELYEGLKGIKKGEQRIIEAVLPEGIYEEKYAKKKAKFNITAHEIKERKLPSLDDEFVKKYTQCKNITELKQQVKDNLHSYKEKLQKERLENELFDKLLKYNKFDISRILIEREKKGLLEQTEKDLVKRGFNDTQVQDYKEKIIKDIEEQAEKRIKLFFIFNKIAKEESLNIQDSDLEKEIKKISVSTNQKPEIVKDNLKKKDLIPNLFSELQSKKVIKFLLENSKITEK